MGSIVQLGVLSNVLVSYANTCVCFCLKVGSSGEIVVVLLSSFLHQVKLALSFIIYKTSLFCH